MKKEYPDYSKGSTTALEKSLSRYNKTIFNNYMVYVSTSAGVKKQINRRQDILQIQDVIQKDFDKWEQQDLEYLVSLLKQSERAIWTEKGILITLVHFLRWQYKDWFERFDDFRVMKKRQKQLQPNNSDKYNKETMPTPEDLDLLIRTADKLFHKLWISMAGEAGLPYAVQANLKFSNIEIDSPQDNITTLTYYREKNKAPFIFPLGKVTTYYLKQWEQEYIFPNLKKSDYIFPSPQNRNKPITSPSIHSMLNKLSKRSGLNKHLYQYLIRHRVLSDAYAKEGMTEEIHRKLFGHRAGSKMTKFYSHQDEDETLKRALELLHKVKPLTKEQVGEIKGLRIEIKKLQQNKATNILRENLLFQKLVGEISDKNFKMEWESLKEAENIILNPNLKK